MSIRLCPACLWIWAFLFYLAVPVQADMIENLTNDFKLVSGYIVAAAAQGDYVIDLDASKGIAVGDIFQVFSEGSILTHPVTGESIGSAAASIGVLKVTRLQSGYSYARALGSAASLKRGQIIRRFDGASAFFQDESGQRAALATELKKALPFLDWRKTGGKGRSGPARQSAINFIAKSHSLEVLDSESDVIRSYALAPIVAEDVKPPAPASPSPPKTAASPAVFSPEFQQHQIIGKFSERVTSADFLRVHDRLLMAVTEDSRLRLFHVDKKMKALDLVDMAPCKLYSVRWWQPAETAEPYLAVTAWRDDRMESAVYVLEGRRLKSVKKYMPYLLGAFDRNGDGRPEILLGQNFDRDIVWGKSVKQLYLENGRIQCASPSFDLPPDFPVTGSLFADLTGDDVQESIYIRGGRLRIFSGSNEIYQSAGFGGSTAELTYELNPDQLATLTKTVRFEIAPLAADLKTGGRTLLAPEVNQSSVSVPSVYSGFKNTQLSVFKYQNSNFIRGTIGEALNSPIQGMAVDQNRILFVQSPPASLTGKNKDSFLCAFAVHP